MERTYTAPLSRFLLAAFACVVFAGWVLAQQPEASGRMTNERVIEMSKLGLGDEVIIARIKVAQTNFTLADEDLLALKGAGVSDKVVAAMLEASVLTEPLVTIDGQAVELHTLGESKTGGRIGSFLTGGIKSVKVKAYLQGPNADVHASPTPTIRLELPPSDTADNYIVVRLDDKDDRRELEVASAGGVVGAKAGLRAEDIVRTSAEPAANGAFHLKPVERLKRGEYMVYIVGSMDSIKGIYGRGYDFSVE